MKKWIAFLLALTCLLSLCACSNEENAEEETKSKYVTVYLPVEKIYDTGESYTYAYDENGNMTEKTYSENGIEAYRYIYTYDENGNMIEIFRCKNGISVLSATFTFDENGNKTVYYYDEYGEIKQLRTFDKNGNIIGLTDYKNGEKRSCSTRTYDKDGNIIESTTTYYGDYIEFFGVENGQSIYTYDRDGNLIELVHYEDGYETERFTYIYEYKNNRFIKYSYSSFHSPDLKLNEIKAVIYDDLDRVIREEYYDPDDKDCLDEAEPIKLYTYVFEGDKEVEYSYYKKGELNCHITREYNKQGDIIKQTEIYYEDSYEKRRTEYAYEYTYDDAGNIIRYKKYNNGVCDEDDSYTCTYIAIQMTRKKAEKLGYI